MTLLLLMAKCFIPMIKWFVNTYWIQYNLPIYYIIIFAFLHSPEWWQNWLPVLEFETKMSDSGHPGREFFLQFVPSLRSPIHTWLPKQFLYVLALKACLGTQINEILGVLLSSQLNAEAYLCLMKNMSNRNSEMINMCF